VKFGTDGVRGLALVDVTLVDAHRLARAVAQVLPSTEVLIARDTRESGPAYADALTGGFARAGVSVADLGVAPTPALAYNCAELDVPGVMVSASHNPWHDNGLKVFSAGGRKLSDGQQEAIERTLAELPGEQVDAVTPPHLDLALGQYADHVVASIDGRTLDGLAVVIDCGHGAASEVAPAVLERLGADLTVLNASPDGRNINDSCGSTDLTPLRQAVLAQGAAAGLAFDGDADRVLAVDHRGVVVDGDGIIAIAAIDRNDRGLLADGMVVITIMSNLGFHRAMAAAGVDVTETPVGDRHVLDALDRNGWSLGGEQSGHVIFRDLATTGDGLLTGVQMLDIMGRRATSLADLASVVERVPQLLENLYVAGDAGAVLDAMAPDVESAVAELGARGRVVVRASGTEPLLRIMVEADEDDLARAVTDRLVRAATAVG